MHHCSSFRRRLANKDVYIITYLLTYLLTYLHTIGTLQICSANAVADDCDDDDDDGGGGGGGDSVNWNIHLSLPFANHLFLSSNLVVGLTTTRRSLNNVQFVSQVFEVLSLGLDTAQPHNRFATRLLLCCSKSAQKSAVRMCHVSLLLLWKPHSF